MTARSCAGCRSAPGTPDRPSACTATRVAEAPAVARRSDLDLHHGAVESRRSAQRPAGVAPDPEPRRHRDEAVPGFTPTDTCGSPTSERRRADQLRVDGGSAARDDDVGRARSRRHPGDPEVAVVAGRGPGEGAGIGLHASDTSRCSCRRRSRARPCSSEGQPTRAFRGCPDSRECPGSRAARRRRLALYVDRHAVGAGLHGDLDRALRPVGRRRARLAGTGPASPRAVPAPAHARPRTTRANRYSTAAAPRGRITGGSPAGCLWRSISHLLLHEHGVAEDLAAPLGPRRLLA